MTMLTVTEQQSPHQVAAPAPDERKHRITGKVRTAVDAMVWQGLKRADAAQLAGLKDNSLYVALARPDVRAYYLRLLDVLRTSERARNIHTLAEVRDQQANQMARVQAVKALEQLEDSPTSSSARMQAPGLVLVIQQQAAPAAQPGSTNAANIRTIEHEQHQEHE